MSLCNMQRHFTLLFFPNSHYPSEIMETWKQLSNTGIAAVMTAVLSSQLDPVVDVTIPLSIQGRWTKCHLYTIYKIVS